MQLQQAIAQVRVVLNEATPRFWSNSEIRDWLNEGAQLMCSEAKLLTNYFQFQTVAGQQEYPLPQDCEEVVQVYIASGTVLRMVPLSEAFIKGGGFASGLPTWCYFRMMSNQFANVVSPSVIEIKPVQPQIKRPSLIIGFYPIPSQAWPVTIPYYQRHYYVGDAADEFAIPDQYIRGLIAYAAACGKRKEQAVAEFQEQMSVFKEFKDRLCEAMINNGQEITFPRMKVRRGGEMGGSSWIALYVGDATYD